MARALLIACALGAAWLPAACGARNDAVAQSSGGSGGSQISGEARPARPPAPATCPPGNAIDGDACVVVVTPEDLAAVSRQEARLDELARMLDGPEIGAALALLGGLRRLEAGKAIEARPDPRATAGAAGGALDGALDGALEGLRALQVRLGDASARLGNLRGELERLLAEAGAAPRIEEVRAQVQAQLRAAVEPLAADGKDAILPLASQLPGLADTAMAACAADRLSGGGKRSELCARARRVLPGAIAQLEEIKARLAKLSAELAPRLAAGLAPLIDAETRKLLGVPIHGSEAGKLPPAASGAP